MIKTGERYCYKTTSASGARTFVDDATCHSWWVFPLMSTYEAREFCVRNGIEQFYNGPGSEYAARPCIRHSLTRTLITQRCGLDV